MDALCTLHNKALKAEVSTDPIRHSFGIYENSKLFQAALDDEMEDPMPSDSESSRTSSLDLNIQDETTKQYFGNQNPTRRRRKPRKFTKTEPEHNVTKTNNSIQKQSEADLDEDDQLIRNGFKDFGMFAF